MYLVNISTDSEIIDLADSNRYLRTFTCNTRITNTTLKCFLEEGNRILFKKVYLATLVETNDYNILNHTHLFVDGTDANTNGSKHYKIYRGEYETLIKLHEYGLLSKKRQTKEKFKNREKYLIKKYANNLEVLDLIKEISKRPRIYTERIGKLISVFEKCSTTLKRICFYNIPYSTFSTI